MTVCVCLLLFEDRWTGDKSLAQLIKLKKNTVLFSEGSSSADVSASFDL